MFAAMWLQMPQGLWTMTLQTSGFKRYSWSLSGKRENLKFLQQRVVTIVHTKFVLVEMSKLMSFAQQTLHK